MDGIIISQNYTIQTNMSNPCDIIINVNRNVISDLEVITDKICAYILNSTNKIHPNTNYPLLTVDNIYNDMLPEMRQSLDEIFEIYDNIFKNIKESLGNNFTQYGDLIRESVKILHQIVKQITDKIYTQIIFSDIHTYLFNHIITKLFMREADLLIDYEVNNYKKINVNIICMNSFKEVVYDYIFYISMENELKIAKIEVRNPTYLINIKDNACNCPDYIYRQSMVGGLCKHLKVLNERTKKLAVIKEIQNKYFYNINLPLNKMLNHII